MNLVFARRVESMVYIFILKQQSLIRHLIAAHPVTGSSTMLCLEWLFSSTRFPAAVLCLL